MARVRSFAVAQDDIVRMAQVRSFAVAQDDIVRMARVRSFAVAQDDIVRMASTYYYTDGTKFWGATCFDESCPVFVSLVSFVAIVSFVREESLQLRICWVYPSFGRQKLLRMSDQRMLISCSSCCT